MQTLAGIFGTAAQMVAVCLLADFASGVFHWAEDALGSEEAPFWAPVFAAPNALHHRAPSAMMKLTWWYSSRDIAIAAAVVVVLFRLAGAPGWQTLLFFRRGRLRAAGASLYPHARGAAAAAGPLAAAGPGAAGRPPPLEAPSRAAAA